MNASMVQGWGVASTKVQPVLDDNVRRLFIAICLRQ